MALMITVLITVLVLAAAYRSYAHQAALQALQKDTAIAAKIQAKALESELQKFSLLPLALSENPHVHLALSANSSNQTPQVNLNEKLASLAAKTGAPYIFVVDRLGRTIASSNHDQEDSFVGRRYGFRPYFKQSMAQGAAQYVAKGERTGKAGLFFARRVDTDNQHLGIVVVKVEFAEVTNLWKEANSTTFIVNSDKIILFSSDESLNYSAISPLSETRRQEIYKTKQFGDETLNLALMKISSDYSGTDSQGRSIIAQVLTIPELDWQIYRTVRTAPALKAADIQIQLRLLSAGILILGVGLFTAWRVSLERQRAQTTAYLETEVERQTKELSNANSLLEHEIHEREQVNKRFRNAREELAQANRLGSIGTVTASVAHEINQPVAAIHAFAESAIKLLNRKDSERAKENLKSIVSLTSKIGAITAELRCYARRGSQSISRISTARISVDDVIDGVELLIGERIRAAGTCFQVLKKDDIPLHVKAGRVRLEQVIVNLLQNASEAVHGLPSPTIEMLVVSDVKYVYITISDNGPGIEKEIEKKIFTPFFTTKPDGVGIGLGIANDIMNEFGGSIKTTSSPLGGAALKITLQKL